MPAADHDADVLVAVEVEVGADLLHQRGSDAATLGGGVEPHGLESAAHGVGDSQRLFHLVLEGVDQGDAGDVRRHVLVEQLEGRDRVADAEVEGVGAGAGGGHAREPCAEDGGAGDAAAHDRGVVHDVGHVGVDVPCAEGEDRDVARGLDALAGGGGPSGAVGQDAQDGRLVHADAEVGGLDPQGHLAGANVGAFVERPDLGGVRRQRLAEEGQRLLDAAQDASAAGEDLHDDRGVDARSFEHAGRPVEVDVGGLPRNDLRPDAKAGLSHSRSLPGAGESAGLRASGGGRQPTACVRRAPSTRSMCCSAHRWASGSKEATQSVGTSTV